MKRKKILFLGGGNMAEALIGALVESVLPDQIHVIDPADNARDTLIKKFGVSASASFQDAPKKSDVILLAVKPQHMRDALKPLSGKTENALVISIAAGLPIDAIAGVLLGTAQIIRVMPNTPALVKKGISGLYAPPAVTAENRALAEKIMRSVGEVLWLQEEAQIDAVTAISGSGPAYVFCFLEAMQNAATRFGFSAEDARRLSLSTVEGAAVLAQKSADSVSTLREKVTSKGGTTAAALDVLAAGHFKETLVAACEAAASRSRELGSLLSGGETHVSP